MPTIQNSVIVLANTVNDNVLTGSQWEFLPYNARIDFGLVASATGIRVDVYSGQDTVAENYQPNLNNRFPIYPDDFTLMDVAGAGERLKVRARNTTVGDLTLFFSIQINPV